MRTCATEGELKNEYIAQFAIANCAQPTQGRHSIIQWNNARADREENKYLREFKMRKTVKEQKTNGNSLGRKTAAPFAGINAVKTG